MSPMPFLCHTCGQMHEELPDITADKPDNWWSIPEKQRKKRIRLTSDTCILDDESFFIRGVIHIPIHENQKPFGFGVWVSQKRENFYTYLRNYETTDIGPFFGWLCT